jgi:hypothetical protein
MTKGWAMASNITQVLAVAAMCAAISACGPTQHAPSPASLQPVIPAGPEGTKQLCKEVLSGVQLDTQSLVDLSYEINPHNKKNYVGPNKDCYDAVGQQLEHPK